MLVAQQKPKKPKDVSLHGERSVIRHEERYQPMRGLAGCLGALLALFGLSLLFVDLSILSDSRALALRIETGACLLGGFGLPIVRASRGRGSWVERLPLAQSLATAFLGTLAGGSVGHLLVGPLEVDRVFAGIAYSLPMSLVVVPAVGLLAYGFGRTDVPAQLWVFTYGSLMSGGWEQQFDGAARVEATLEGYRRAFNKLSTRNWGSPRRPCPTLGLEPDPDARCVGVAFPFPEASRPAVLDYLRKREGPSFELEVKPVVLVDGTGVDAVVPVNRSDSDTYVGNVEVAERAAMVRGTEGKDGSCQEYVQRVRTELSWQGVSDPYVEDFARAVEGVTDRGAG
jgi:cation transport protein ChaC